MEVLTTDIRAVAPTRWPLPVAQTHPEHSLDIYGRRVQANLTHADFSAYQRVADYLQKMRPSAPIQLHRI